MQKPVFYVLLAASIWDVVTTFLGLVGILGIVELSFQTLSANNIGVLITSLILSFGIAALSFSAIQIWEDYKDIGALQIAHILAIAFDFYTSFLGTAQHVILAKNPAFSFITIGLLDVFKGATFTQIIVLFVASIFFALSPILLVLMSDDY